MKLLDLIYHVLTNLAATLPTFLTIDSSSEYEDHRIPGTFNSYDTCDISIAADTGDTADPASGYTITALRRSESGASAPVQRNQKALTVQTAHSRHDMNSARMSSHVQVVQELPSAKEEGVLNPHTGFPEPLSPDRNTTLPHPSADTSENATLEADDLQLTKTQSRARFLHSRHQSRKRLGSYGKISPVEKAGMVEDHTTRKESSGLEGEAFNEVTRDRSSVGQQKNEAQREAEESEEILRLEKQRDEQGYLEGARKKGVLRKLRLHKV